MNVCSTARFYITSIVLLVFFFCESILHAEQSNETRADDVATAMATMTMFCQEEQIEACLPEKQFNEFKRAQIKWKYTGSDMDWIEVTASINALSKSKNLQSKVTISTEPQNGADVYYQTWIERKESIPPHRFPDPTVATDDLYLGEYFIWTERKGKPTSNKDATYRVVKTYHTWTIKETTP